MTPTDLQALLTLLQSMGVRRYRAGDLELELDPIHQPTTLIPRDPEEQRASILQQLKDLQKEEDELEAWST